MDSEDGQAVLYAVSPAFADGACLGLVVQFNLAWTLPSCYLVNAFVIYSVYQSIKYIVRLRQLLFLGHRHYRVRGTNER